MVPQKVKHRMTVSSSISTSGYIPRKIESKDLKDTCTEAAIPSAQASVPAAS